MLALLERFVITLFPLFWFNVVVRLINVVFFFYFGGISMKIEEVFRIVSELDPAVVTVSDRGNRRVREECLA